MDSSLLDYILKLPKKNAPVVISILLGIIIAGTVGGGFWINSLQSTLAEREKLETEKLTIIEERYRTNFNAVALRVSNIENQIKDFQSRANESILDIKTVSENLAEISSDPQLPEKYRLQLSQLSFETSTISKDLKSSIDIIDISVQELSLETQVFIKYGFPPPSYLLKYNWFRLYSAIIVIVSSIALFFLLKKHLTIKITWKNNQEK